MDAKWKKRDLKLVAETKTNSQDMAKQEDWTVHVADLIEGDMISWCMYGGYHREPYANKDAYKFTFLSADENIRIKATRIADEEITLDMKGEWVSDWYKGKNGCYHRVSIRVIESLYPVSELPDDVRTFEQTDRDAWEYAVRNNLIPHN
jgi:hypothetical protein